MQRVRRRRLEAVPLVEPSGLCVLRLHQHGAHTDEVGRCGAARERLDEHLAAEPTALFGEVHGEPCEHDDRDRLEALPLDGPLRGRLGLDAAGGQGAVGDHGVGAAGDLGVGPAGTRVGEGAVLEVVVERGRAAGEGGDEVSRLQRLGFEQQRAVGARCLQQTVRLVEVLRVLQGDGIPAMPLKGPALGELLHGDLTLRNWTDLDVLVPYGRAEHARRLLLAAGFRDRIPFSDNLLQRGGWAEPAIHLCSVDTGINLDLHWRVSLAYSPAGFSAERLLEASETRLLLGQAVCVPSATDTLLMSAVHGTNHRWDSAEAMLALAVQAGNVAPQGWPGLLAAARAAGCRRRLTLGVVHVCRVLDLPVPDAVGAAVRRDPLAAALLRLLRPDELESAQCSGRRRDLERIAWHVGTEDSAAAMLRHLAVQLLLPGPQDWEWTRAAPGRRHYALRLLRLARKWTTAQQGSPR